VADLAGALVHAMLSFADARIRRIEADALSSAAALADFLGGAGPGADLPSAGTELGEARTSLATFRASLAGPATLGAGREAATQLGAALRHLDSAVAQVRPGSRLGAALGDAFAAPIVPMGVAAQLGLRTPAGLTVDADAVTYRVRSADPVVLPGVLPIRLDSAVLAARLALDRGPSPFRVTATFAGLSFVLRGSAFDGFLAELLGSGTSVSAAVTVGVDVDRGLTVASATSGPVTVPVHASGGTVDVPALELDLPADAPGMIDVGAQVAAALGPVLSFTVAGAGVRVRIDADHVASGTPIALEARRPRGLGVSLDAGLVRGGGYLETTPIGYAGSLEVRIGPMEARAFGILDTTARPGFSMVVVMSAEFEPAVELGLGFTVNGVGGVVGLQRALDSGALLDRIHDHAVDRLLFPADPVAAAPQILATLGAVFPPRADSLVVGPMVRMGWGRPVSFVTASAALLFQLPDPKIAILGTFELAVPSPSAPIVHLKGEIVSEITPEHILVLIVLEDSRIAGFPVSGDVGILIGLGSDPSFAVSAGGFHPRYAPPAELAGLRRLSVDLSPPVLLTIRASAYVALTTNSFQLGGRLEASGEAGPVSIHGFVQLDAIVRWAPSFSFEVDLSAGFDMRFEGVSFAGVSLSLHLQGPAPWMLHGTATLEIPILPDIDVEVGPVTWGERHNPPPPEVHPRDLVRSALSAPEAWRAEPPSGADAMVTLRSDLLDLGDPAVLVHPLGNLEGRQRAVPLETKIARVGPSRVPANETRVHLGQPTLRQGAASVGFGAVSGVEDHFAPGAFLDLSDEEKLRQPAFVDKLAGIRLGPRSGVRTVEPAAATQSDLHYDTVFPGLSFPPAREPFHPLGEVAFAVLGAGAAGRSILRNSTRYAAAHTEPLVFAAAGDMRIRRVDDLSVPAGIADEPLDVLTAAERLAEAGNPPELQLVALGTELG
jgi:hypothetical protein